MPPAMKIYKDLGPVLSKWKKRIVLHILKWNEYFTIPLALIIWILSPYLIRIIDPTASLYDAGIFQIIIFGSISFLFAHGLVWIVFKLTWPQLYDWLDNRIEELVNNGLITPYEKLKIILWLFTIYMICAALFYRVI